METRDKHESESAKLVSTALVMYSLYIHQDFQWHVRCHGKLMQKTCPILSTMPAKLHTILDLEKVLTTLDECKVCEGNPDERFHQLTEERSGCFWNAKGK